MPIGLQQSAGCRDRIGYFESIATTGFALWNNNMIQGEEGCG